MSKIRFGPSGNEEIFYSSGNKKSIQAPEWLKSVGLDAYEYSFGRGFTMGEQTAKQLGEQAKKHNVLISVHAPYYVNLANPSEEMAQKSYNYVLTSLKFLEWFGGQKVCVHLASQGTMERAQALALTRQRLETLCGLIMQQFDMTNKYVCPETMGKYQQIGNEREIVDLCTVDTFLVPTFDFGHLNCLKQGKFQTEQDYKDVFDYAIEKLGYERVKNCHIHFSQIEFGHKGEIRHLNFGNMMFGPDFEPLAKVLYEYKLTPTIICESESHMATDAMAMRDIYNQIANNS